MSVNPRYLRRKLRRLGLPVSPELEEAAKVTARLEARARRSEARALAGREAERAQAIKVALRRHRWRLRQRRRQGMARLETACWNHYRREMEKLVG